MEQKNAWIYCRIDAPEDTHGALKGQYGQLERYAEQMGFTVVGSSQDLGNGLNMERPGLLAVREAIKAQNAQVLLVSSVGRIGRDTTSTIDFIKTLTDSGARIFSPLEGEITAAPFFVQKCPSLEQEVRVCQICRKPTK